MIGFIFQKIRLCKDYWWGFFIFCKDQFLRIVIPLCYFIIEILIKACLFKVSFLNWFVVDYFKNLKNILGYYLFFSFRLSVD